MVEFSLLLGTNPDSCLTFKMDLIGEIPGPVTRHSGNVFEQTIGNVLKRIEVIVENNHFVIGVGVGSHLTRSLWSYRRSSCHGNRRD